MVETALARLLTMRSRHYRVALSAPAAEAERPTAAGGRGAVLTGGRGCAGGAV